MKRWKKALGSVLISFPLVVACGEPEVIVPQTLSVVSLLPSHGTTDVSVSVEGLVYFSHPVADATAAAASIQLVCLGSPDPTCGDPDVDDCDDGLSVTVTVESANGQVARVVPDDDLQTDTCYSLAVLQDIEAAEDSVAALPIDVRSTFQTSN